MTPAVPTLCPRGAGAWSLAGIALLAAVATEASATRFSLADPVTTMGDTVAIPAPSAESWNLNRWLIDEHWSWPWDDLLALRGHGPSRDVNCLEEVPACSWFSPHRAATTASAAEIEAALAQATGRRDAPIPGALSVLEARIHGAEPYALVSDPRGSRYRLEFDDPAHPQLRTGAAVIASRLLHAAGFNVLETIATEIPAAALGRSPEAIEIHEHGGRDPLSAEEFAAFVSGRARGATAVSGSNLRGAAGAEPNVGAPGAVPEGVLRVAVGRLPEGEPKGGFRDRGTRPDDPNDRIAHEDRRVLRGLLPFAAWLDHPGWRPDRTLDIYLRPQGYLRHYLGGLSASLRFLDTEAGPADAGGGGSLADWRPRDPFRPFEVAEWSDFLWGLQRVFCVRDEQIRAAVAAARLADPAQASRIVEQLLARRDALGREWLDRLNSADAFAVKEEGRGRWRLTCRHVGAGSGLAASEGLLYVATFHIPGAAAYGGVQARSAREAAFDLSPFVPPAGAERDDPRRYVIAALRARDGAGRELQGETRVHIYCDPLTGPKIVGLERD